MNVSIWPLYFSKSVDLTYVSYVSTGLTWVVIKDQETSARKRASKGNSASLCK